MLDTRDGQLQSYGDVAPYTAASTAKVLTAAAYYHLVETGDKSLDAPLGAFNAAFQLKAMINTSSDDSWLLLMRDIGYPNLTAYAATLGITYDPEQNLVAPTDMARLLAQLATGKLLNADHTAELLGYMQHTNDEDLIPAASRPASRSTTSTAWCRATSTTPPCSAPATAPTRWSSTRGARTTPTARTAWTSSTT